MGIVLLHGDAMEKIPVINTTNRLEYLLTTSMEKLINKVSYLLALKGNIHIDFYLSPELLKIAPLLNLNGLSAYPQKIQNIVKDLNKKYYGKLKYEFIKLKVSENNEKELIQWLYDNQSQQDRKHLENRLFIIMFDNANQHWKMKSEIMTLKKEIDLYVDNFNESNLYEFDFGNGKVYSSLLWITKR